MLKCRVFDVLYFAVFQQCKIKTAKQKTASLTLAVLMVEWGCLRSHTFCTIYSLFGIVYG